MKSLSASSTWSARRRLSLAAGPAASAASPLATASVSQRESARSSPWGARRRLQARAAGLALPRFAGGVPRPAWEASHGLQRVPMVREKTRSSPWAARSGLAALVEVPALPRCVGRRAAWHTAGGGGWKLERRVRRVATRRSTAPQHDRLQPPPPACHRRVCLDPVCISGAGWQSSDTLSEKMLGAARHAVLRRPVVLPRLPLRSHHNQRAHRAHQRSRHVRVEGAAMEGSTVRMEGGGGRHVRMEGAATRETRVCDTLITFDVDGTLIEATGPDANQVGACAAHSRDRLGLMRCCQGLSWETLPSAVPQGRLRLRVQHCTRTGCFHRRAQSSWLHRQGGSRSPGALPRCTPPVH